MTEARRALRHAIDAALSPLAIRDESETSCTFRATIHATSAMTGPPGRLHGGLHPVMRLVAPLAKLTNPNVVNEPLAMRLRMRKAIPLLADVPLEGRFVRGATGSVLTTRAADSERLDAELRTGFVDDSPAVLARFRALLDDDGGRSERERLTGHGELVFGVGPKLVRIDVDPAFAEKPGNHLATFLGEGPSVDPVFTCAILDVLGAYAIGMNLDSRLFTTELELVVRGGAPLEGAGMIGIGSREAEDVPGSDLPKVSVRGVDVGEQRVEVLLADAALTRAYGYGRVSLVPVRREA